MLKTIILLANISALTACYKLTPIEITSQGDSYGTKIEGASTICQNLKRL